MGEHRLNLSEEVREIARKRWAEQKRSYITTPGTYLKPTRSNVGKNHVKRLAKNKN